ncbi:uncharacterized protein LOC143460053 [Clavelina lepadiformis]|uniref:uncharacterized protein LOC143460053 n=1 Tax=Clavelina lepadiformis TaxID=159417 RepID=UPI004040F353
MPSGPIDIPRGYPVTPHLSSGPRFSGTSRNQPAASYPSSQVSGKSPKKEPVHLPCTSANPEFADLPAQNPGVQGGHLRPETSYPTPRHNGIRQRLPGFSMAAYYCGNDVHILPSLRNSRLSRNSQMLPQISVVPALKHNRLHQKQRFAMNNHSHTPQPVSVKRVEVSLHEVQTKPNARNAAASPDEIENFPMTPKFEIKNATAAGAGKDIVNLPLKSIDLNKGLNAASAIKRRTRESARKRVATLEESLASKNDTNVLSLSHLPLKEAYLKPDSVTSKEQASKQQQDKTIRILKWLKELRYLDEKTVQRARLEVERTHFQLPEIKESALSAFV